MPRTPVGTRMLPKSGFTNERYLSQGPKAIRAIGGGTDGKPLPAQPAHNDYDWTAPSNPAPGPIGGGVGAVIDAVQPPIAPTPAPVIIPGPAAMDRFSHARERRHHHLPPSRWMGHEPVPLGLAPTTIVVEALQPDDGLDRLFRVIRRAVAERRHDILHAAFDVLHELAE